MNWKTKLFILLIYHYLITSFFFHHRVTWMYEKLHRHTANVHLIIVCLCLGSIYIFYQYNDHKSGQILHTELFK